MYSDIVKALPKSIPFKTPESLEREWNVRYELRLGANENLWGPSPSAIKALPTIGQDIYKYNDPECYVLRQKLAELHKVKPECLVFGEGIDGLLGLAVRALVNPGDAVVTSKGSYPTFEFHVNGYGGNLIEVPYHTKQPHLAGLLSAAKQHGAKLVYLANPDNPSGYFYQRHLIEDFIASLPEGTVLVLDEAYGDFVDSEHLPPISTLYPNVIRMRTFSKAYGLAGLRVGYGIAVQDVVENFDKVRLHFGVNSVGQALCFHALDDVEYVDYIREQNRLGRQHYYDIAHSLNLEVLPSETNFVAIDVGSQENSIALLQLLAQRHVFIRRPNKAPLDRCIRVSVAKESDRKKFGETLTSIYQHHFKNGILE